MRNDVYKFILLYCHSSLSTRYKLQVSFKEDVSSECFIERVMLHEPYFWKKVKCAWHNLFMSAYFGDSLYKKDIGVLFIKNYSAVFRCVQC